MGIYIDPPNCSKEDWLLENAEPIPSDFNIEEVPSDYLAVCLVNNGAFTAAAVIDSGGELEAFRRPDGRPRVWFQVAINKLKEVIPSACYRHLEALGDTPYR